VSSKGISQLAVREVPHLNSAVPRRRHNSRLKRARAETHTANPIRMSIAVLNGVLAFSKGVPQFDRAVTRRRHDLTVVDGERHGEDVLGVSNKAAGGGAGCKVPEAELAVPGAGERKLAVGRKNNILNEVGVTGQTAAWDTVGLVLLREMPQDDGFVARRRDYHVGVVNGGGNRRYDVGVGAHGAAENETLCHFSNRNTNTRKRLLGFSSSRTLREAFVFLSHAMTLAKEYIVS